MSQFSMFMKQNKVQRSNAKFLATSSLKDENGIPLEWEFRPLSTRENECIRESCLRQVESGRGQVVGEFDHSLYLAKMIACSVVFPNLNDAGLQNSYNVLSAEDLLKELVDCPAEYQALTDFVTALNGFNKSFSDKVDEAKK